MTKSIKKELTTEASAQLLDLLKTRFAENIHRHKGLDWNSVLARLEANQTKLWSLNEMEKSGGEPDVVGFDKETKAYIFCDCAAESPAGRRSLCYDQAALLARKKFPPKNSAQAWAEEMGVEILTETQYLDLQKLGPVDTKTSSWLATPAAVRKLGGAIFADYRFGRVFVYHNGADSYYAGRGFRAMLRV